jgi:hypothetical protein
MFLLVDLHVAIFLMIKFSLCLLCNGNDSVVNHIGGDMPTVLNTNGEIYVLHGRVYATSSSGTHFYSVGVVGMKPSDQFLVKFNNLAYAEILTLPKRRTKKWYTPSPFIVIFFNLCCYLPP